MARAFPPAERPVGSRAAIIRESRQAPTSPRRAPGWVLAIYAAGGFAYVLLFARAITQSDPDLLAALIAAPIFVALTVPIAVHIARREGDATLFAIVMAGIVAKLIGAALRWYVAFEVYGNSDSLQYHLEAVKLAPQFREGNFDPGLGPISGTVFMKAFTGFVYALFGASKALGFFVFAFLGFLGLILLARAFRIAVPQGNARRYLILVLFLPSLVYWPSAIGKEAWMMLGIGLAAYGIARLFTGRLNGFLPLAVGTAAIVIVRPHIALIMFIGFVLALLLRRVRARTYAAPFFRMAGLIALLVVGVLLAGQTADFLDQPSLTTEAVSNTLTYNETQTADGGSEFNAVVVRTPLDMGPAFATIFFRPFPFEATNAQALFTSAECMLLILLVILSWNRIRAIPRLVRSTPYVTFCIGYVLAFVFAFSSFSNFGILARQRVQVLPFFLVFLALPDFRTVPSLATQRERARPTPHRELPKPRRQRARRPMALDATAGATPAPGRTQAMHTQGSNRTSRSTDGAPGSPSTNGTSGSPGAGGP